MTYTAPEMLDHAKRLELSAGALRREGKTFLAEFSELTAQMLRQAADAMDAERRKSLDELAALSQELGLYDIQRPK